ncbi:MAG: hypothetical protein HXX09_01795 [Bacteroidetes bacterium]|nr:hypothetical protein [Bacteroidota bacterium]
MKRLLYLIFISFLFILSCEKDEFPACNCGGNSSDKICSQYLFENDESIGYINFEYNSQHLLTKKSYFNKNGGIKKLSIFEYSNKLLTKETVYKSNNSIDYIRLYTYNSYDSINSISCVRDDIEFSKITIEYNNERKRITQKEFEASTLKIKSAYEYDSEGLLLKIKKYDGNDSLQSMNMYEFFLDNIIKIRNYGTEYSYLGNDVFKFDDKKQIINAFHYGSANNLVSSEVGEFENSLLSKKTVYNAENKVISYAVFKYY